MQSCFVPIFQPNDQLETDLREGIAAFLMQLQDAEKEFAKNRSL